MFGPQWTTPKILASSTDAGIFGLALDYLSYSCFKLHKIRHISLAVLFGLMLVAPDANGQDDSDSSSRKQRYVCITTVSNVMRCGYLKADNGREITLETPEIGVVILPKSDVISIQDAAEGTRSQSMNSSSQRAQRNIFNPDRSPQSSRYFFAPSALPMETGEGYAHINPMLANVTGQISDNLMLGGALSWLGIGATMKVSRKVNDNTHVAIGGMGLIGFYGVSNTMFPFVNLTKGDHNNNYSIAVAALVFDGQVSPMVNFSSCKELSPRAWIITENYFFADPMLFSEKLLLSVGGRWWSNRKNRLEEFALMMMITEDGDLIPLPWLGATWPF